MVAPETEIIVTKDGAEVLRQTVAPGDYVIGREAGCDVHLNVELVSRRHAQLTVNHDHVLIEDLGSSNGTFINGEPVSGVTRLWPNQKIQIGAATIELHRLKTIAPPDVSLAPGAATMQRLLPEELLREKKYEVGKVVAQGGMGAILDVHDAATQRGVAMKVMLDGSSPDDLTRFVAEARVTAQLEHPNIVPVHELSVDENGQPFYTMKMVRGITLKKVLELMAAGTQATLSKYPLGALLTIFQKVCDAIAFAHARGVIHRDLKPENIMLGDFGEVLVMDWGLAKVIGQKDAPRVGSPGPSSSDPLSSGTLGSTMVGTIMGTPQYMAPEQARGEVETMDQRADIYALGAILYHLLALRPSVTGGDAMTIVGRVARGDIEPLTLKSAPPASSSGGKVGGGAPVLSHLPGGRIPDSLVAVVRKAMALDVAARYRNIPALQADIEAYQNGFATSAEDAGWWKRTILTIKRNKVPSAAAALILVLTAGFMAKVIASERKAQQNLAALKATAPTFQAQALALIETTPIAEGGPKKALEHIGFAIALSPESADYLVTRGRILQTQLRFEEARTAFTKALALAPAHPLAKSNIPVCENALRERLGDGTFSPDTLFKLATALTAQGRNAEALHVTRSLAKIGAEQLAIWNAILQKAGLTKTIRPENNGRLTLDLNNERSIDQVNFLRGIPLTGLFMSRTLVTDLSPLAGMPLRHVDLGDSSVTDITPLAGMPLEKLSLSGSVTDISPLRGAPIEVLQFNPVNGKGPSDYSVLRDMPLRELTVSNSEFADLRLLEGKPLRILRMDATKVTDLSLLRDLPLENLYMDRLDRANPRDFAFLAGNKTIRVLTASVNRQLVDLSALRDMAVETLVLNDTGVTDLSPLAGSKVSDLNLNNTPFKAAAQLAALPRLTILSIEQTQITDLGPLAALKLQRLSLYESTRIASVKSLAQIPTLRMVILPPLARDLEALRNHPSVQWLGYGGNVPYLSDVAKRSSELARFWEMTDLEKKLRAAEPDGRLRPSQFPFMQARFPRARQSGAKWYNFVPGKFTWPEAKQLATDLGGHLATITSEEEFQFVKKSANLGQGQLCWLGGEVDKPEGTWRWITGEPWAYTHWAKWKNGRSEPNYEEPQGRPKTKLCFYYAGAVFASLPDICNVIADHENASGLIVEWED